jgi:hypothetical protein
LAQVISCVGPPLFSVLATGSVLTPSGRPSLVCGVLKQFFRLLRVAVENRKSASLCPAVTGVCVGHDVTSLVLHPALLEELGPAYFGVVYCLLSVHWRQFVITSPPDHEGVRRRAFSSQDACIMFTRLMDVITSVLSKDTASPGMTRLALHILKMWNQVQR